MLTNSAFKQCGIGILVLGLLTVSLAGDGWAQKKDNPKKKWGPITEDEQLVINKSIQRGVAFLKAQQNRQTGTWGKSHPVGYAALCGLAMLECGEPWNSPHMLAAAGYVRAHIAKSPVVKGSRDLTNTYELSAAILFLDALTKAGEPKQLIAADVKLIQLMALRLIAGQQPTGGWSYNCPAWKPAELQFLFNTLLRMPKADSLADAPAMFRDPREKFQLPPQVANLAVMLDPEQLAMVEDKTTRTDNSCTHFAILGLWVAGGHNVPLHRTMDLLVKRFRVSQNGDGGWGYTFRGAGSTKQMTCIGLLGMAVGYGLGLAQMSEDPVAKDAHRLQYHQRGWCIKSSESAGFVKAEAVKDPADEKALVKGFSKLTKHIGDPNGKFGMAAKLENLYYLWALERVAVLFNLPTVGEKEWYRWAAEMLIANQDPATGGWIVAGGYHGQSPELNTAMALFILKRSNLTSTLTEKLPFSPGDLVEEITVKSKVEPKPDPTPPVVVVTPKPTPKPEPTPVVKTPPPPTPTPAPEPEPVVQEEPESGGKTLITIAISLVGLLLLAGAGAFVFLAKQNAGSDDDDDDDEDRPRKKRKKRS